MSEKYDIESRALQIKQQYREAIIGKGEEVAKAEFDKMVSELRELMMEKLANDAKRREEECTLRDVSFFQKMLKPSEKSIEDAKNSLPIVILPMLGSAICIAIFVYQFVRWQFFGITKGVTDYYLDNFDSAWDSYLWIASEMGVGGMIMFCIMALLYIYVWRGIYIAFFY